MGTPGGVCKVRTVRRKGSDEDRWNLVEFNCALVLPWEPIPGRPGTQIKANIGPKNSGRKVETQEREVKTESQNKCISDNANRCDETRTHRGMPGMRKGNNKWRKGRSQSGESQTKV